jgi:hypothetical protein
LLIKNYTTTKASTTTFTITEVDTFLVYVVEWDILIEFFKMELANMLNYTVYVFFLTHTQYMLLSIYHAYIVYPFFNIKNIELVPKKL